MVSAVLVARSRLGVASRTGSTEDIQAARRDLAAANVEQYLQNALADAPPLTPHQRARLITLIGGAP